MQDFSSVVNNIETIKKMAEQGDIFAAENYINNCNM